MKKLLLLAFLGISTAAFIAGCKKDTAKPSTDNRLLEDLKGKWAFRTEVNSYIINGVRTVDGGSDYGSEGQYIQFNDNGAGVENKSTGLVFANPFSYTLKDTVLTVNYAAAAYQGTTYEAYTTVYNIHSITNHDITLNSSYDSYYGTEKRKIFVVTKIQR